jgi:hypothetical protein
MASSTAFEWICQELESATSLDRLEARGTVRIALKQSGLEAASVTGEQLAVVLGRVLPGELTSRGIDAAESICQQIAAGLDRIPTAPSQGDTPEAVFARLGS